jgi:stringent starvation protein B
MTGLTDTNQGSSTRPYLLRALHEWCTDNGFTPYIAVHVDQSVQVPMQYVKNNEIVLNVGFEATSGLKLGNEAVEFRARFGGVSRDIMVPVDHVVAIYARENGQGMAFPMPTPNAPGAPTGAPVPVASARGPRLAAVDNDASGAGSGAPAVEEAPAAAPAPDGAPDPAPPSGPRPSLKRIK